MPYREPKIRIYVLVGAFLLILEGYLFSRKFQPTAISVFIELLSFGIMVILSISWMGLIRKRVIQLSVKKNLDRMAMTIFYWVLLRHVVCWYPFMDTEMRYLLYAYYIPIVLLPVFGLSAAVHVGMGNRKSNVARAVYIPAVLLMIFVMTNDLHGQFLIFGDEVLMNPTVGNYGPLHFLIIVWNAVLILVAFVILIAKSHIAIDRSLLGVPFLNTVLGLGLVAGSHLMPEFWYQLPEAYSLMLVLAFETCIEMALIPSNIGYEERFSHLTIPARLVDKNGNVVLSSEAGKQLPNEESAERFEQFAYDIRGGQVVWEQDLSDLFRIRSRLEEQRQLLESEQEILYSEYEAQVRYLRAVEQNNLYNEFAKLVQERIRKVQKLIQTVPEGGEEEKRRICLASIYTAHIKRECNLMLLSKENQLTDVTEIRLCIQESINYLHSLNIPVTFSLSAAGKCSGTTLMYLFRMYEEVTENALQEMNGMMVFVSERGDYLDIRFVISGLKDDFMEYCRKGKETYSRYITEYVEEDDVVYMTGSFLRKEAESFVDSVPVL